MVHQAQAVRLLSLMYTNTYMYTPVRMYMEDKKQYFIAVLNDIECMLDEIKQTIEDEFEDLDDGKKWEESE